MAEKQLKRRRINGTHRWSEAETLHLVIQVSEEVKDKPESFEKPTAQIFYKQISAKSAVLKPLDWVPMKNKMRHLKSTYMSALDWKNQTGAGLLATGDEQSVTEYIEKICPQWNYLEQIFGQRRGVNPSFILQTSSEAIVVDIDIEETDILSEIPACSTISFPEPSTDSQSPDSQSSLSSSTSLKKKR